MVCVFWIAATRCSARCWMSPRRLQDDARTYVDELQGGDEAASARLHTTAKSS